MPFSSPETLILPSLVNSTVPPLGGPPSCVLTISQVPTASLALSFFLSSATADETSRQTATPTASSFIAFMIPSLVLVLTEQKFTTREIVLCPLARATRRLAFRVRRPRISAVVKTEQSGASARRSAGDTTIQTYGRAGRDHVHM